MPRAFVKQPNGFLAIWSSVVDNFITVDCTADEAIKAEIDNPSYENYPGNLREDLCRELENIANEGRAWKWAPTWDEAIVIIKDLHGADEAAKVEAMITTNGAPSIDCLPEKPE